MKLLSYLIFSIVFVWCLSVHIGRLTDAKTELEAIKEGVYVLVSAMLLVSNLIVYYLDKDK